MRESQMRSELVAKIKAAARRRQTQGDRHGEVISIRDGAARRYERTVPGRPYKCSSYFCGRHGLTHVRWRY
jgi:hypothetical protein